MMTRERQVACERVWDASLSSSKNVLQRQVQSGLRMDAWGVHIRQCGLPFGAHVSSRYLPSFGTHVSSRYPPSFVQATAMAAGQ